MIPEDLYSSGGESNPLCMLDVEVVMNSQTPHTHITIYNRGSKDVRVRPSIYDDRMLSQDGVFTSVYFRTSETSVESGSSIDLALNNRDGVTGVLFGYLKLEDLDSSAIRTFPVIYHAVSTP